MENVECRVLGKAAEVCFADCLGWRSRIWDSEKFELDISKLELFFEEYQFLYTLKPRPRPFFLKWKEDNPCSLASRVIQSLPDTTALEDIC